MRNIFFVILMLFSAFAFGQSGRNEEFLAWIKTQKPELLAKFSAEETAKKLPIQMNSLTLVTGIFALDNVIVFRVQVLATKEQFIAMLKEDGKTLFSYKSEFKTMMTNQGCTQEVNKTFIAQGVNYRYMVSDKNHQMLFDVTVTSC